LRKIIFYKLDGKVKSEEILNNENLEFTLYPKINLWDTGEYMYIKSGNEIQDVYTELTINLTDRSGVYTGQKYVMIFEREEVEKIVAYMEKITNTK